MTAKTELEGGAIHSAPYRWYVAAQAVSLVGTTMGYAALYWLAVQVAHENGVFLSIVVAVQFLPMLLFSRNAGIIVARYQAARLLVVTQGLQVVGALAYAVPLLAGWVSPWYICFITFAVGTVLAVDVPARQMFMLDLVGSASLRRGASLYSALTGLSKIIGPGIAGAIIAASGEAAVFLADAASFLFVLCVLVKYAGHITSATKPDESVGPSARRFRWVLDLPKQVQVAAGIGLLFGGLGYQFEVTNPLMASKVFGLGSLGYGLMGTCIAVGGIAGNYFSSRRPDPSASEFLIWAILFGGTETFAAVMPQAWAYDLAMVVIGFTTALFASSAVVYVQQTSPDRQRAHALTAYNMGFLGFVPAGAFAVGAVAATVGSRWALIGPGLLLVLAALLALLSNRPLSTQAAA